MSPAQGTPQRRRRKQAKQRGPTQAIPAAAVLLLGVLLVRKLFQRKQRRKAEPEGPDYSHLLEPCEVTSAAEHAEGSSLPLLGLRLAVSPL